MSSSNPSPACVLNIQVDERTGQLIELHRPDGSPLLRFHPAAELRLNGVSLETELVSIDQCASEHITIMHARITAAYGAGVRLEVRRILTLGAIGGHTGRSQTAHIRYEIRRIANTECGSTLDYIWQPEIESPFTLDRVDVLCAPTPLLGKSTRLRALAIGGSGPRDHVSFEDAPIAEVVPLLRTGFRSTFPGQPTINGGLLYNPDDQRFVWAIVRRPYVGGRMDFAADRIGFQFYYFLPMPIGEEIMTPAVSLMWGTNLDDADRVLAEQFDVFEEPPDWWYRTAWFWLHPNCQADGSFQAMGRGAEILHEQCGVNGFGMFLHDVPWAGRDCDVASPRPSPTLGGDRPLREVLKRFNDKGIHSYVWMSQKGHRPDGPGYRESWAIKGIDPRCVRLHDKANAGVRLDIVNPADPSFEEYIFDWIRHYVCDLGVTGIFWDSGFQPIPPDFGDKPYVRFPGQSMASMLEFYRKAYRFGRSLSPDFFMWIEGISTDVTCNGFAVDKRDHEGACGHALMHRLAHRGPKRLVWRSAWPHDVSGAFPFLNPVNDVGWAPGPQRYEKVAADPMNQWLCRTVRERGMRSASGLGKGISRIDEFIIVSPGAPAQEITIDGAQGRSARLEPIVGGDAVASTGTEGATRFSLQTPGAYRLTAE